MSENAPSQYICGPAIPGDQTETGNLGNIQCLGLDIVSVITFERVSCELGQDFGEFWAWVNNWALKSIKVASPTHDFCSQFTDLLFGLSVRNAQFVNSF